MTRPSGISDQILKVMALRDRCEATTNVAFRYSQVLGNCLGLYPRSKKYGYKKGIYESFYQSSGSVLWLPSPLSIFMRKTWQILALKMSFTYHLLTRSLRLTYLTNSWTSASVQNLGHYLRSAISVRLSRVAPKTLRTTNALLRICSREKSARLSILTVSSNNHRQSPAAAPSDSSNCTSECLSIVCLVGLRSIHPLGPRAPY